MYQNNFTCLLIILLFFVSCSEPAVKNVDKRSENAYFDLNRFIQTQTKILDSINPSIKKEIGGKKKTMKDITWAKELELFRKSNLNQPFLKGMYEVIDSMAGERQFVIYKAREEGLPVRYQRIEKNKKGGILSVFTFREEKNMLYHSQMELQIRNFTDDLSQPLLKDYLIKGKQTGLFGFRKLYQVKGERI